MLSVHGRQNAVGTRLKRQMQVRHQLFHVAVSGDEVLAHVAGMAGGIAQPLEGLDPSQVADQLSQAERYPARPTSTVGVDVLAQQGELASAVLNETLRFRLESGDRAGGLRAARIWHHAKRAELVAAF